MAKIFEFLISVLSSLLEILIPRRVLGSLSWRVSQYLQDWQNTASDLRRNTWFERVLLKMHSRPWWFLTAAFFVWLNLILLLLTLSHYFCVSLGFWTQRSDLLTYFGTAWAVQVTVVALVYPLVIAFVTLLLQRRSTAKVALVAYLLETGVKPAGSSSFVLLTLMTIQYLALPWMSTQQIQAAMTANVAWLAVNMFMTGWFLSRTAQYFQDERRIQTLLWLTQCVTLPNDVRIYVMGLFLQNAQSFGWIKNSDLTDDSPTPKVVFYPMKQGRVAIERLFPTSRELENVHFKLLSWAVDRWVATCSRNSKGRPLLELPCTPDIAIKNHVLCRVRDAEVPDVFSRFAILLAYRFRKPVVAAMPFSSVEVMNELAQEAVSQIEVRREPGLKLALDDLVTVHVGLLCASRFPSNDGPSDWVCLLQDPYGFGSQPMCRSWMEPYRAIAEAAVVSLEREDRFFSRVAGLSARLIRKVGMQSPVILIDLMLSSTLLMYHLGRWWNQRVENQSTVSPYGPRLLSQPLRNIYRDAVQSWIGYWEEIHIYIDRDVDFKDDELWTEHATRVKVYAAHIDETARLLLSAVARGDAEAARRLEDSLVKWWGGRQYEFDELYSMPRRAWESFDLTFANQSWEEACHEIPELPGGEQSTQVATSLLMTVLKRYWKDVCVVTSLVLLEHWHRAENYSDESLCFEIVGALIGGKGYDEGGATDGDLYQDTHQALARLTRFQHGDQAYTRRLDRIVERFLSDTSEPMTLGRMYSSSGAQDVNSLVNGQAIYLAVLLDTSRDGLAPFEDVVNTHREDLNALRRISRYFASITEALRRDDFKEHLTSINKMRDTLKRNEPESNNAVELAIAVCEKASTIASKTHDKTVDDAPLDTKRLFDLAKRVHDRIFSGSESNFFPIALTTDFIPTGEELDSASQSFTGITMLPFTNPPLEPIGEHLVKWISQYLADRVFADAMARLQRQVGIEPVRDDNKDAFFSDLSMRISSIEASGFTPVILVAGGRRLNYLSPYRLPEDGELPEGFSIRPAVGSSRGLLATLNDVEIYSVPMISSRYLVLPKEYLERLRYQKFSNAIGLAIDRKNESKGKFDLKFTFACEFEVTSDRSFISQPSV